MTQARDRFVHQDRPLVEWPLQLVDADAARRRAAADVITNRFFLALDVRRCRDSTNHFSCAVRRSSSAWPRRIEHQSL
jgi:hypothetical protein